MLNEAKLACQVMDPRYEPELCRLIDSGIRVLKTRGVHFNGCFSYTLKTDPWTGLPGVEDWQCNITDDWVKTAILTYVRGNFPNTKDGPQVREAFEDILSSMMNTNAYTDWKGETPIV